MLDERDVASHVGRYEQTNDETVRKNVCLQLKKVVKTNRLEIYCLFLVLLWVFWVNHGEMTKA